MHLTLNVVAVVALIPLLSVTAAPLRGIQKRANGAPQLLPPEPPTVFKYDEYAPPEPEIGKREATARLLGEVKRQDKETPSVPHITVGPQGPHCENDLCDDNYPDIFDENVEKSKRQDGDEPDGGAPEGGASDGGHPPPTLTAGPTPLRYDPYAPPHCSGGLCDVRYPQVVKKRLEG